MTDRNRARGCSRRHPALNLEIRLEVRHQKGGGDSLAGDVSRDQPETPSAKVQEIEIVAANLARLDARARVFECPEGGGI